MRGLQKWAWAAVFAAISAVPATAQQGGIQSGGQPSGGVGLGGGSTIGGGSSGGGSGGGIGGGGSGGGIGGGGSGIGSGGGIGGGAASGQQQQTTYGTNGINKPTGTATSSLQRSNFLAGYYANPYAQGLASAAISAMPSGFGAPLHGTTTGGAAGGGNRLGAAGAGGLGGRGGLGGQNSANQSGIVIQLPVQIAYTSQFRFSTPPVAPTKLQSDLRLSLDNTSMLSNSKTIQISTDLNNNVTLRGTVADADEARLAEGMVRLTPGVGEIKNELSFPAGK